MNGCRIPVESPAKDPYTVLKQAGDYYGPVMGWSGDRPAVFYLLPIPAEPDGHYRMAHVCSPPHKFTEEQDGTLTITESILSSWGNGQWHGYLTNGVWREC